MVRFLRSFLYCPHLPPSPHWKHLIKSLLLCRSTAFRWTLMLLSPFFPLFFLPPPQDFLSSGCWDLSRQLRHIRWNESIVQGPLSHPPSPDFPRPPDLFASNSIRQNTPNSSDCSHSVEESHQLHLRSNGKCKMFGHDVALSRRHSTTHLSPTP